MNNYKRLLSICLSLIVVLSFSLPLYVYAAGENELRNKVVSVAENEIGYTATSSYSKYGEWYGYQGGWCTTFAMWCFNQAGSSCSVQLYGSIIPSGGNCNSMISWFSNRGEYYKQGSGYTPKAGDLVFFDWSGNGSSQHVGIVSGVSGSTIYTIEGNCSGAVKSRSYTSNGSKPYNNISSIMGYGVPDYSSAAGNSSGSASQNKTTKRQSANTTEKSQQKTTQTETKRTTTKKENSTTQKETTEQIALENLSINASTYDLKIGDSVSLNYSVEPHNAPAVVGYFCDDEGIIDISSNGEIRAVGEGTATVVVCANNELYSQCDFTVTQAVASVTTTVKTSEIADDTFNQTITNKNAENVLTNLGINVNALSKNKQLYVIPITIIGTALVISVFVAITKKIKHKNGK